VCGCMVGGLKVVSWFVCYFAWHITKIMCGHVVLECKGRHVECLFEW
jgi:hypothetical protein